MRRTWYHQFSFVNFEFSSHAVTWHLSVGFVICWTAASA
jgi:hypothetical protein